jgi:hypothetical protein
MTASQNEGVINIAPGPLHAASNVITDKVILGNEDSEKTHEFVSDNSLVRTGGLGEKCRAIMPREPDPEFIGGSIGFTLKCDPELQNYITVKLWGSEIGETVLYLYHNGMQIGSQQSDWPVLDKLNWRDKEPAFAGRFFYTTYLIPYHLTKGRNEISLQIVSTGFLYSYAPSYERAKHDQKDPSRGIYAVYTHTDPFFPVPADEKQGVNPGLGPVRPAPEGVSEYDAIVEWTQRHLDSVYRREPHPLPNEILGIAKAYNAPWSRQYQDKAVLEKVIETVDDYALKGDHRAMGWFGHGELAEAVWTVYEDLDEHGFLDQEMEDRDTTRKELYADFFRAGMDHGTTRGNRGGLTNQDIYIITSVYRTNLLLKKLAPHLALPEEVALDYVYQAMGIRPYDGRRNRNPYNEREVTISTAYRHIIGGPVFFSDRWDYYWVTPKGSSKEHGYVHSYGELAYQTSTLAELTGDEKVRQQAMKMIRVRAPFRVMGNDEDGYRAMKIEAVIGWRLWWYPGKVEYGDEYFKAAAVLGDEVSVWLAQLYMEHNRAFLGVRRGQMALLVDRVDHYKKVSTLKPSEFRFPMDEDQPDFAWADEGIGAVVFKHADRKVWMTLGWRGAGISNIARIHYTTDSIDRIANVRIRTDYTPSGYTVTRPDEMIGIYKHKGLVLATDGEALPIAEGPLGGKGDFYQCRYGDYLIAMNCTHEKTFEIDIPSDLKDTGAEELISGRQYKLTQIAVQPQETLILYIGRR